MSTAFLKRILGVNPFKGKCRKVYQGYGLMLVMLFLVSTVLIGTSIQMMLGVAASNYLSSSAQDNIAAKELADSGMEIVLADIQSKLNANTSITTSYTYASSNIVMPNDPASLAGGNTTIGSFSGTVTAQTGNIYTVQVTATVGSSIATTTRVVNLNRISTTLDAMAGANAAYGLRLLNSTYTGSAIRVRRSSDNAEQDIGFDNNGNLDLTSLNTFLASNTAPLDSVGSAAAAFGLRRLRIAYKGAALTVRRSSDNATQDIGFTAAGDLDITALTDFVGTGSGYVTTWYDQSGNGNNASNGATNNQPMVVENGKLTMVNNRPAMKYVGVYGTNSDLLDFNRTISDDFTIMACFSVTAGDWDNTNLNWFDHSGIVDMEVSGTANDFGTSVDLSGNIYAGVGGGASGSDNSIVVTSPGYNDNRMHWMAFSRTKSTGYYSLYVDNASYSGPNTTPNTASLTADSTIRIGGLRTGTRQSMNGYINEVLVYGSTLSNANQQLLQRNESRYYNMNPLYQTVSGPVDAVNTISAATPAAAYGLRKMRSAYGGYAIKVRRSSDSTTQDIGFDAVGNLDVSALFTFVGSGSGYINTWYDQSGNTKNVTQATASKQPQIVNAGVLISENGKPALQFLAASSRYFTGSAILAASTAKYTYNAVAKAISSSTSQNLIEQNNSTQTNNNRAALVVTGGNSNYGFCGESNDNFNIVNANFGNLSQVTLTMDTTQSTNINTSINGITGAGATSAPSSLNLSNGGFAIGEKFSNTSEFWNGTISEILVYSSVLTSAQIKGLGQNQLQYFSVSLPPAYVTIWYDQSGNGFTASQTNPLLQPTLSLPPAGVSNNRPTIVFNGGQRLNTSGGIATAADYSIAAVYSYFDSTLNNDIVGNISSTNHKLYMGATNYLKLWHNSNYLTSSLVMTPNTNYAISTTFLESSRTGIVYRSNTQGGSVSTGYDNSSATLSFGGSGPVATSSPTLKGSMSEAIVFSRVLNAGDRTIIYNDERKYFGAQ